MLHHFQLNTAGRDFVVGDIHGCFSKLERKLLEIGFDEQKDRLFSVGDLVDRGPESANALEWLDKPWFHAVRGNHEQMAIDAAQGNYDAGMYAYNGGAWFLAMTQPERLKFADAFSALPVAMDIETSKGLVGVIHAECQVKHWSDMEERLGNQLFVQSCIWSRDRAQSNDTSKVEGVEGVERVIVGHTPMQTDIYLGNVHYIDTGAVFGRDLTIVQIQ